MLNTIDGLIAILQKQKESGVAGDTPVFIKGTGGYVHSITGAAVVSIAKPDFEKGKLMCKLVSNRGVTALTIVS